MAWCSKDIREDLKELKRLYHEETDVRKKEELAEAIRNTMYVICDIELEDRSTYSLSDAMTLFNSVPKYNMYYPEIDKFSMLIRSLNYNEQENYEFDYDKEIDKSDIYPMLRDFYKSVGREIYYKYAEIEDHKDTRIKIDEDMDAVEGNTFFVPVLNKIYMQIGDAGDNRDVLYTLTHEFGHGISALINPKRYYNFDYFYEIESIFFELLGLDYYYRLTGDTFYSDYMKSRLINQIYAADEVIAMRRVMDRTFNKMYDADSADELCKKHLKQEGIRDGVLTIDVDKNMKYLFSYLVAVELFEAYKEDPDLGINLFNKIIKRDKEQSEYQSIYSTVTPVKSMKKHIERLSRY